jgi:hypothetical protein
MSADQRIADVATAGHADFDIVNSDQFMSRVVS